MTVMLMDYISVRQAAAKWGKSERWVQKLCEGNRIKGVVRFGHVWMIPKDAEKPVDPRKARCERGEPYHTGKKGGGEHSE